MTPTERKLGFIQSPQLLTREAVYRKHPYHGATQHLFDTQAQMDYFVAMARKAGWQVSYPSKPLAVIVS